MAGRMNLPPGFEIETFDPEGADYDYATAVQYGMRPDETGHWASREPTTGLLLKGKGHETWPKTVAGEKAAGFEIYKQGERYYSRKKMNLPAGFEIEKQPQIGGEEYAAAERYAATGRWSGTEPDKNLWQALQHGWKRAGIQAKTGLAGLMQAELEIGIQPLLRLAGKDFELSASEKKAFLRWSTSTIEKADRYYEEHPEEAMQLEEDAGFLATTWDVVSHPEKLLQGVVEAVPLMAEAAIGTAVGGPAGGIVVMAQPIVGNTYQTARKKGTDPFPAFMQATLTGYGEAAIEQYTFGKKIGLAKGMGKIIKSGWRILWEGIKLYVRGTAEEGTQKFNENLWNWVFTDRSQILTEGVMQAAAVGGPLETVMGGAFAGGGMILGKGKGEAGGLVPNSEKIRRMEALRNRIEQSSISDEGKVELYAEFEQTIQNVLAGKFDTGPVEIEVKKAMSFKEWQGYKNPFFYGETNAGAFGALENQKQHYKWYAEDRARKLAASPETQLDAAETIAETKAEAIGDTQQLQGVEYGELLELAKQGDELAAYRIQEMTAEAAFEEQLPTFEVLFEQMLEGDEVAKTALQEGRYKGGRLQQVELQPPIVAEETLLRKVYSKGFVAKLTSIRNNADNIVAGAGNKESQIKVMKSDLAKVQEHYDNISEAIKDNPELLAELGKIEKLLPEYTDAVNSFAKSPSKEGLGQIKTVGDKIAELSSKYGERLGEQGPTEAKKGEGEEFTVYRGAANAEIAPLLKWYTSLQSEAQGYADAAGKRAGGEATVEQKVIRLMNPYRTTSSVEVINMTSAKIKQLQEKGYDGLVYESPARPQIGKIAARLAKTWVIPFESPIGGVNRGRTRVDSTIPATDEQARNFATIKVHSLARLLGLKKKDRQQIQFDLIGQKSLKGMSLEEVKKVEDYFVAQAKERGLSTSTGKELADFVKLNTTQNKVQDYSKQKPAALKRMLQAPWKLIGQFAAQSKRVERMLEALDGFTEGPVYNSIWTATHTQTVNSRVSRNERVAKFKEALVDIMTPELQTDEGITAAAEFIAEEETAAGKKARKLGKRAVRKLVGDSLWARYITSGREVIIEATDTSPELSLNPSERIGVYLAMKNEDSRRHLIRGNFAAFENPDLTALSVVEAMSSQEREIGDWILRDLEANFERANSAAKLSLGRDLEQQDNYFPIHVLDIDVLRQKDFLSTLEDKYTKQVTKIEPSEVKERKRGAIQPLNVDAFNVYLNHLTRIEQFIHMAPVAKSVGKILNTREFRQAVNNVTAGHGTGILDRWLKNSIRGHAIDVSPGLPAKTMLWMRKKGVLFFLAGNIPSVARQFISGFDAVSTHPMTLVYAMQHMIKSADPRYYNMLEKRMRELSPEMDVRSFERYLANIKHQAQAAGILTGKKQWSEKALSWQRWADRRTVVIIWNAFYDAAIHSEAIQKTFEVDGSEESAIHLANKMTARTQPMGDVEHLPDFFTAGPIERLLSTFQNQINNRWNFWAHDIYGMRKHGKISNQMVMWRVLFSQILPAMMFGAISRGGLPDDWKDVLFDQTIYAAGPIFLIGRILTDAMLGFSGGRTDVEDALTANVGKTVQAVIKGQPKKAIVPAIKTVGGLSGRIPNSLIRAGQGVYDIMTGETDDLRRLIYSDWSLTNYGWSKGADEGRKPIQR